MKAKYSVLSKTSSYALSTSASTRTLSDLVSTRRKIISAKYLKEAGNSVRTIDPEYPMKEDLKHDRKKHFPESMFHSQIGLSSTEDGQKKKRISEFGKLHKRNQESASWMASSNDEPNDLIVSPRSREYVLHSAKQYAKTNSSSILFLPESKLDESSGQRKQRRHQRNTQKSSIPYLSDDGYEPKYEPKDPSYHSTPIWLRDGDAESGKGLKKLSNAKFQSLQSRLFQDSGKSYESIIGDPVRKSNLYANALSESFDEQPMFSRKKGKPEDIKRVYDSSFKIT